MEERYRVILNGYGEAKGEYYIEEDFAKLFKMTREQANALLEKSPTPIKENLSIQQANQYKEAIDNTGARCEVESMQFNTSGLSLE